ncbi:MAG: helix-turn-helix domain-containing protein [Clostridia bacterium]|nr:helix-turn-helix domain-containing protein [Clostridia bacterium]
MSDYSISRTKENTKRYPLHRHNTWEIMYYLEGEGNLVTVGESISFSPGTVILVPPRVVHGSVSENSFINISVGGDFNRLFLFDHPVCIRDASEGEGAALAKLIYANRFADGEYLSALCTAYAHYLLQYVGSDERLSGCVKSLVAAIRGRFYDPAFSVAEQISAVGYAPDYLRAAFKKMTGDTPIGFLTKTRIAHARRLLEIYGHAISIGEVAASSGFTDAAYFSKRFKQLVGCSPDSYRRGCGLPTSDTI